jgi:hypothetical protein
VDVGTGAAGNALSVKEGPIKLTAMADVFQGRLDFSYDTLKKQQSLASRVDVPEDHKFIGFDGYKHAMDSLRPGDIAIFTTPLAFRWVHFTYAIQKKLNVSWKSHSLRTVQHPGGCSISPRKHPRRT